MPSVAAFGSFNYDKRLCQDSIFKLGKSITLFSDVNPLMDLHPIQEGLLYHQVLHHATDKLLKAVWVS